MATVELEGGTAVPVTVWRDDARGRDATHTVYWPLDSPDPVIALGVVRAAAGTLTVVYTSSVYAILTAGEPVTLDTDECPGVPSRAFVVTRLEVTHASDDPTSTTLIRAEIQDVEVP